MRTNWRSVGCALLRLDIEDACVTARAFADAHIDLPADWRGRNRELEFDVIKNALHAREFIALTQILPWLRDHEAGEWLLDHLPEGDPGELIIEASGAPALAPQS